jgi:hypothetical protein
MISVAAAGVLAGLDSPCAHLDHPAFVLEFAGKPESCRRPTCHVVPGIVADRTQHRAAVVDRLAPSASVAYQVREPLATDARRFDAVEVVGGRKALGRLEHLRERRRQLRPTACPSATAQGCGPTARRSAGGWKE